jgi:membrane protein YqaA with SNARE-associated domain
MAGYGIGWWGWEMVSGFFFSYVPGFTPEVFQKVADLYQKWDFWAVAAAGLTPIPYKVFTIAAGVFGLNFPTFVLASVLSRGLRFGVEGWLILRFGPPMAVFIDRYFNWLTLAFVVLLVGGFGVLHYLV